MQQVDVIVEARMTSSRLPGKVLMPAAGKPLLQHMIDRLKKIECIDNIIIATTKNPNDDQIEYLSNKNKVRCFRGSENDVLGRVYQAAEKFNTDIIVEITGDNPLIDRGISTEVIQFFIKNQESYDYVSNDAFCHSDLFNQTCLLGFNTKVFQTSLLKEIELKAKHPIDREHVINYIFNKNENFKIFNFENDKIFNRSDIRLTLDYPEDYIVIKNIFDALYRKKNYFSAKDIITYLDSNPKIKDINANCIQQKYKY